MLCHIFCGSNPFKCKHIQICGLAMHSGWEYKQDHIIHCSQYFVIALFINTVCPAVFLKNGLWKMETVIGLLHY